MRARRCVHPGHDMEDCWAAFAFGVIGLWDWCKVCDKDAI